MMCFQKKLRERVKTYLKTKITQWMSTVRSSVFIMGRTKTRAMMEVIEEYGAGNTFLIFEKFLDAIVQESYREIRDRWINRLAGVDVFGESHAETMMIYVRWDDKL